MFVSTSGLEITGVLPKCEGCLLVHPAPTHGRVGSCGTVVTPFSVQEGGGVGGNRRLEAVGIDKWLKEASREAGEGQDVPLFTGRSESTAGSGGGRRRREMMCAWKPTGRTTVWTWEGGGRLHRVDGRIEHGKVTTVSFGFLVDLEASILCIRLVCVARVW